VSADAAGTPAPAAAGYAGAASAGSSATGFTRADVEDFLYREAALLDAWRLDEWLALLTDDATYRVPANDQPEGTPADTLFLIADDLHRLRGRVTRLNDPHAHAEFPHSRTRRMIANVRIVGRRVDEVDVESNFTVHRFRRGGDGRVFVGSYRHTLRAIDGTLRIARREAILDAHELGGLGAVSFLL
jgi:p-cumate 2,3-dioxygenase beta subunit